MVGIRSKGASNGPLLYFQHDLRSASMTSRRGPRPRILTKVDQVPYAQNEPHSVVDPAGKSESCIAKGTAHSRVPCKARTKRLHGASLQKVIAELCLMSKAAWIPELCLVKLHDQRDPRTQACTACAMCLPQSTDERHKGSGARPRWDRVYRLAIRHRVVGLLHMG